MRSSDKHGPEVADAALKQRAIDGALPTTGKKWAVNCSSQFSSWRTQLHALNEAATREARNMPRFTGEDKKGNLVVRMEVPSAGRGYVPNKEDFKNPLFNGDMKGVEVKFDYEALVPVAAYPIGKP
ncbi:hypothetical protein ACN1C3_17915 [Pseudomonas sp. H11T01]|uniref:hypothetical protein n=1 Tax=Pseudomonas sp. H11T01 TaxID=3402749 RepID=UPI003AC1012A